MTRILRTTIAVLFVACLLSSEVGIAQSSQQAAGLGWEKLSKGGQVLRLWTNPELNLTQPQVAVLQLPEEEYRDFKANPREYLQRNRIFGEVTLNRIISQVDLSGSKADRNSKANRKTSQATPNDPPKSSVAWTLVVAHNLYCDSATISYSNQ